MADDAHIAAAAPALGTQRSDPVALRHLRGRLWGAEGAPWLHREVARRMAERLPVIKMQPTTVVDWWATLGGSADALAAAYPSARRVVVRPDDVAATRSDARGVPRPAWWSPGRWRGAARPQDADSVAEAQLAEGAGELLWANMTLHFAADPLATMRQWRRMLAVDGFLMFSTLGPGSLGRLRDLYRAHGWSAPHAPFVDMHDLGDMLIEAGFADPVMDQETLTLTWADGEALLAELRTLGGNADTARYRGLRTPRWRRELVGALARDAGADDRIALDLEIVYGHAFRPPPRARVAAETTLPVQDLRAMMRAGRRR